MSARRVFHVFGLQWTKGWVHDFAIMSRLAPDRREWFRESHRRLVRVWFDARAARGGWR